MVNNEALCDAIATVIYPHPSPMRKWAQAETAAATAILLKTCPPQDLPDTIARLSNQARVRQDLQQNGWLPSQDSAFARQMSIAMTRREEMDGTDQGPQPKVAASVSTSTTTKPAAKA